MKRWEGDGAGPPRRVCSVADGGHRIARLLPQPLFELRSAVERYAGKRYQIDWSESELG
jgi:hypothetical protein